MNRINSDLRCTARKRIRYSLALILVACVVCLGSSSAVAADLPTDKVINYSVEKKSVQYVVIDLAKQVGLGYDWNKSAAQTDPERRVFVNNLRIKNETFDAAMQQVLKPVKLRYEIEEGKVVLYRQ